MKLTSYFPNWSVPTIDFSINEDVENDDDDDNDDDDGDDDDLVTLM